MIQMTEPTTVVEADSVTVTDAFGASMTIKGQHLASLTPEQRTKFADALAAEVAEDSSYASGKAIDQFLIEDVVRGAL